MTTKIQYKLGDRVMFNNCLGTVIKLFGPDMEFDVKIRLDSGRVVTTYSTMLTLV